MSKKNPEVDAYLAEAGPWRAAMTKLRAIALDCGLAEELKWRQPCYTAAGGNIAIIQGFKHQCAFMFFKGALLADPDGVLEAPGPNSHAARRMVFAGAEEVAAQENRLRAFITAAVTLEREGLKVDAKPDREPLPTELEAMFGEVQGLRQAFAALTPGRQRAYILHFAGAKQAATRRSRIEKCVPGILAGKGLRD